MLNARLLGAALLLAAVPTYALHAATGSKMCLFVACMLVLFGLAACVRLRANPESLSGKRVLITGCETGIGLQLALRLLGNGATVFAGCRSVASDGAGQLKAAAAAAAADAAAEGSLHLLQMDVTSDSEVQLARQQVQQLLGEAKLHAVVNNAGIQFNGDMEMTPMRQCRSVMDVNYFGVIRTTQQFLPLIRGSSGRIVTISSIRGRCCWPFSGAYTATKFAVEALMDAWRLELARFGVSVVLVQPGHFGGATNMLADQPRIVAEFEEQWSSASDEVRASYGEGYVAAVQAAVLNSANCSATDVAPVVDAIVEALATDAPLDRYFISGGHSFRFCDEFKWMAKARDWLPVSVHDALIWWYSLRQLPLPAAAAQRAKQMQKPLFD